MRSIGLVIMICGLLTSSYAWCEGSKPDGDTVQWRAYSDLNDGRRFLTDGNLLLDSKYAPSEALPQKSVPPEGTERLLQSKTDHEFSLADLLRKDPGAHYLAPGSILLNRMYIDYLRGSPSSASLKLSAKGSTDPVLILDGDKVVGVMMPMQM